MRYLFLLAVIACFASCSKESALNGNRLTHISSNNRVNQSFEYNAAGKLVKENYYYICDQPADEFTYTYGSAGIQKVEAVIRGIYSSTTAICDRAAGLHSVITYEYDDQQRIKRVIGDNSSTSFTYNSEGLVARADYTASGAASFYSTYQYDSKKNLVETFNSDGRGTTRYEFDNKRNPLYEIESRPDVITAFNRSPNNVVKIINGSEQNSIQYNYNLAGYPVEMSDNGSTYTYHYR